MKLYVVVWSALASGAKIAQAIHAVVEFGIEFPDLLARWRDNGNRIVVVQHDNVPSVAARLEAAGFAVARFVDDEVEGDPMTLAVEGEAGRMLSSLALAR